MRKLGIWSALVVAVFAVVLAAAPSALKSAHVHIWPQHYDALTSQSGLLLEDTRQDAREILTMIAQRKDLMPGFSRDELERARSLAIRDPRIAEAMDETASANLPEILAAAPDLISRWLNGADPYGAAVITAAVIARRCGHPELLPSTVLEPLAGNILTAVQLGRATSGWFPAALDWARAPVRGPASPLTPHATIPGVILGDQVSDVLVQYAARHEDVPGHAISERIWLLLIDTATPEACRAIAEVAYRQRQDHQAPTVEHAIRKAVTTGSVSAMSNLGVVLAERGEEDEAEQWYRQAAANGRASAMYNLGNLLKRRGEQDEAEQWYRQASAAGRASAMVNLGNLLRKRGEQDEAEQWYRQASAAGKNPSS